MMFVGTGQKSRCSKTNALNRCNFVRLLRAKNLFNLPKLLFALLSLFLIREVVSVLLNEHPNMVPSLVYGILLPSTIKGGGLVLEICMI